MYHESYRTEYVYDYRPSSILTIPQGKKSGSNREADVELHTVQPFRIAHRKRRFKSFRGPRALQNVVGRRCVLDASLFIGINKDRSRKHIVLASTKCLKGLQPLMLDNLPARFTRGPRPWPTSPMPQPASAHRVSGSETLSLFICTYLMFHKSNE
jgi:hypothetical protein